MVEEEARVLEAAVASRAAAVLSMSGGVHGLTCTVEEHADCDHNLVVDMRDSGKLHELLCSFVGADEAGRTEAEVPKEFVGFHLFFKAHLFFVWTSFKII